LNLSIVIPVYNCSSFLSQTIESLLTQKTQKEFEIILIDDNSTDGINYLRDYYSQNPKIRWFKNEKRHGGGYSRNFGNSLANGEIISACDAGDICHSSRAEETIIFFKNNPEIDILYSHVQVCSPVGDILYVQEAFSWGDEKKPPISHPTVSYRKKILDKIAYKENSLNTDFYEFFMIDAKRAGFKFGIIPRVLYLKFDLSESENYRDRSKSKEEKFEMYQKYGIEIKKEEV